MLVVACVMTNLTHEQGPNIRRNHRRYVSPMKAGVLIIKIRVAYQEDPIVHICISYYRMYLQASQIQESNFFLETFPAEVD